jgi:hypothetical protein
LDEIVLSSLGYVLLNEQFPSERDQTAGLDQCFSMQSNVDEIHILNFHRSLVNESTEETMRLLLRLVYEDAPYDFVFNTITYYLFNPFVYCVDKEGCLFPPGHNSFIPKQGGPSLHTSSGALYPVPHLDDYVSLLLMKALIPTLNESLNLIFNNIFLHSYYVFCFVDDNLSNAIAKACIKTFLSKAKKELGAEAELISLKRGQFATAERLGSINLLLDGTVKRG